MTVARHLDEVESRRVADQSYEDEWLEFLTAMRDAFRRGDYDEVSAYLKATGDDLRRVRSGIRVEILSMAARAHCAKGWKTSARNMLASIPDRSLKNHRLSRHVAMAYMELGEYRRAAELCHRAAEQLAADKRDAIPGAAEDPRGSTSGQEGS